MNEIKLKEMQRIETDMLGYIDDICSKNNIEYTVVGGTAIGTIRHNGFIPWDDDIDIGLTRENYYKLIDLLKQKKGRYRLLDNDVESTYNYPFVKLVDTKTSLLHKNQIPINGYGVFIDIFKYDGMPNNSLFRTIHFYRLKFWMYLLNYYIYKKKDNEKLLKRLLKKIIHLFAKIIGKEKILKKYKHVSEKYDIATSNYCFSNWPISKMNNHILKSDLFSENIRHKYENIEVNIMKKYDEYLTTAYGDYMKLPPKEQRIVPHESDVYWKENNNETARNK